MNTTDGSASGRAGAAFTRDAASILRVGGPIVLSRIGIMLMGVVDTLVVARHSTVETAYMALGWAPVAVFLVTGVGVLQSVQVMTARAVGAEEPERAGLSFWRGLSFAAIGGVLGAILFLFGPQIMDLLGQDPEMAAGAGAVTRILGYSLGFHLAWVAAAFFLEATGRPMVPVVFMAAANVLNLVLDVWLVHGGFGVPAMGAEGAAWATTVVRLLLALGLITVVLTGPLAVRYGVCRRSPRRAGELTTQTRLGLSLGGGMLFEMLAFAGMTVMAGWVSAAAAATYTIGINLMGLVFMIALGLGGGGSVRVSERYGAAEYPAARRLGWVALCLCFAALTVCAVGIAALRLPLAQAFTIDPELVGAVGAVLVFVGLGAVFDGLQTTASAILRAVGDAWFGTASHFFAYVIVMLPLGYWLGVVQGLGAVGLMQAVAISSLVSAIGLVGRWMWVTQPRRLEGRAPLPGDRA